MCVVGPYLLAALLGVTMRGQARRGSCVVCGCVCVRERAVARCVNDWFDLLDRFRWDKARFGSVPTTRRSRRPQQPTTELMSAVVAVVMVTGATAFEHPTRFSTRAHVSTRRHFVSSLSSCAVVLALPWPSEADDVTMPDGSPIPIPSPLGVLSYGLKSRANQQEACYEAGDCADPVPYYQVRYAH